MIWSFRNVSVSAVPSLIHLSLPFCSVLGKRGASLSETPGFAGLSLWMDVSTDVYIFKRKKKENLKKLKCRSNRSNHLHEFTSTMWPFGTCHFPEVFARYSTAAHISTHHWRCEGEHIPLRRDCCSGVKTALSKGKSINEHGFYASAAYTQINQTTNRLFHLHRIALNVPSLFATHKAIWSERKFSNWKWSYPARGSSLRCSPLDFTSTPGGSWSLHSVQQGWHLMESFGFSTQTSRSQQSRRSDTTVAARIIQKTWFTPEVQRLLSNLQCHQVKGKHCAVFKKKKKKTFVRVQVPSSGKFMHRTVCCQMFR